MQMSKEPEIDNQKYSQVIFEKKAKAIEWEKIVFSTKTNGVTGESHTEK